MKWIAEKLDEPLANVALAWARDRRGVTSLLMGARTQDQLTRNLESVNLHLDPTVVESLDDAGDLSLIHI